MFRGADEPRSRNSTVNKAYLTPSETTTYCPWKGTASYYNLEVDGVNIKDAAWSVMLHNEKPAVGANNCRYYPDPKDKFYHCKDYVAFCMYAPLMLVMRRVPLRFR